MAGMRKLAEAVHAEWRLPAAEQSSVEHWEAQMRFAFAPPVNFTHAEQVTGSHDWAGDARGARVFAYRQCLVARRVLGSVAQLSGRLWGSGGLGTTAFARGGRSGLLLSGTQWPSTRRDSR